MVRTKADGGGRKAVAAKAPRKVLAGGGGGGNAGPSFASPKGKVDKYAGGNSVVVRPTPEWQKGISGFFSSAPKSETTSTEKENTVPTSGATADVEEVQEPETQTSSQGSSSGSNSQSQGSSTDTTSPVKQRNGIISDSDEDD